MLLLSSSALNQLDALMAQYVPERVPAAVLNVWSRDGELLHRAWGWRDVAWRTPCDTDTLFDLASVTKVFVTTAFLILVSRGQVTLDAPIVSVLLEFGGDPRPISGGQDPHSKQLLPTPPHLRGRTVDPNRVTFRHLLTHTSGLAPWRALYAEIGDAPPPPAQPDPLDRATRWQRGLAALWKTPFVDHPDKGVHYSDLGLILLAESIQRLTGQPLDAALAALLRPSVGELPIFNPVREDGLPLERIAPTEHDPSWRGRRVWGEVHDENASGLGGVSGHAGGFQHARGVSALGCCWLLGQLPIAPELQRMATTSQVIDGNERRGLGWMVRSLTGSAAGDLLSPETYGHTGFTGTSLFIDPVNGLVITLLTNAVYHGRDVMPSYAMRRDVHNLLGEELTA
ncbi:serine hydrolase domain-containing protein [Aggregatilineales bacterium SYSU G02658]